MRVFRTIVAALAVAAFTILAQTLLTKGDASAETVTQPAAPANIGIINSAAFGNERVGIARVMSAMKQLEVKFEPLRAEIRGMKERLNTMRADIQKKRGIQDASITARQDEEADRLEIQLKRKQEDGQTAYQKETLAILEPLQDEITKGLNAYAQAKGITLVIDVNRVPILYAAPGMDITQDFINEFNRTHQAGAAPATAPAPARPTPARPTRP